MKGSETRLTEFMDGSKKRFVIPVYQRNYDWKQENCKQLFDDLVKVIKGKRSTHFFGSIVSVYQPSGKTTDYLIVDGQQRLTTVSVLLLAVYNLLNDGRIQSSDKNLAQRIYEEYLVDKYEPEEKRIKLKPVQNDRDAFSRLFGAEDTHIADSHLTKNYDYFVTRILQNNTISADEIFSAIECLQIINIELTSGVDNPQLIFESINSTGVSLTEGDKIRNYVLMDLKAATQERLFHEYWEPIEKLVSRGDSDGVGLFVRDYLSCEQGEIPNIARVYAEFKEFAERFEDREALLSEMLSAAKCYRMLLNPAEMKDSRAAQTMTYIDRQECTPSYPFLLRVLRMEAVGELNADQLVSILKQVDAYVLRRLICDLPTNSLNKVFVELHRGISQHDATRPYEERMAYVLRTRAGKARMPDDSEFAKGLEEKKVYELRTKNRAYFFSRLENGISKSAVVHGTDDVVYNMIRSGAYTLEHVMPQTLTPEWRKTLGAESDRVHDTWLHRMGNLTLTAYNSEMGNHAFANKAGRTLEDLQVDGFGFDSEAHHLFLNEFIAAQKEWTEVQIIDRTKMLVERAKKIWAYPECDYAPPKPEVFRYSVRDHRPGFFTNSKPLGFMLGGIEYKNDSWTSIAKQIIRLLAKMSADALRHAAEHSSTIRLSLQKSDTLTMDEVVPGVFVCCNGSVWDKCNVIKQALLAYNDVDVTIVLPTEIEEEEE